VAVAFPDPLPFVLVVARLAGLVLASPVFGHGLVPVRVRAGLVGVLALALAPVVPMGSLAAPPSADARRAGGRRDRDGVLGWSRSQSSRCAAGGEVAGRSSASASRT
jgi:hypothetical protein